MLSFTEFIELTEEELQEIAFKRVNRVRGRKVQRRVKTAGRRGFKIDTSGKAVRQSASERLKRKRGAIKAARKRRGKRSVIQRKRLRSLQKRKSAGIK